MAESMRLFVNDLKASRRSRRTFTSGMREQVRALRAEHRRFLANIHAQNQQLAAQTREFLAVSKETRRQDFAKLMEKIRGDIRKIHEARVAVTQGAREMMRELHADNQLAHRYWKSLDTDEAIPVPAASVPPPQPTVHAAPRGPAAPPAPGKLPGASAVPPAPPSTAGTPPKK